MVSPTLAFGYTSGVFRRARGETGATAGDRGNSSRSRIAVVRFLFEGWTRVQDVDPDVVTLLSPSPTSRSSRSRQRSYPSTTCSQSLLRASGARWLDIPIARRSASRCPRRPVLTIAAGWPDVAHRTEKQPVKPRVVRIAFDNGSLRLIANTRAMSGCISASRRIVLVRRSSRDMLQ